MSVVRADNKRCHGRDLLKSRTRRSDPAHCGRWIAKPEKSATNSLSVPLGPSCARHVRYNRLRRYGCRRALHSSGTAARNAGRTRRTASRLLSITVRRQPFALFANDLGVGRGPFVLAAKLPGLPVLSLDAGRTERHFLLPSGRLSTRLQMPARRAQRADQRLAFGNGGGPQAYVHQPAVELAAQPLRSSSRVGRPPQTRHRGVLRIGAALTWSVKEREIAPHIPMFALRIAGSFIAGSFTKPHHAAISLSQ